MDRTMDHAAMTQRLGWLMTAGMALIVVVQARSLGNAGRLMTSNEVNPLVALRIGNEAPTAGT